MAQQVEAQPRHYNLSFDLLSLYVANDVVQNGYAKPMIDPGAVQNLIKQLNRWLKCLSLHQWKLPVARGTWLFVLLPGLLLGCSKQNGKAHEKAGTGPGAKSALVQQLQWNLKTTVEAYETIGDTSAKWDEPARRALTEFARSRSRQTEPHEPWAWIIATNAAAAMQAGCTDPMVRYLFIRHSMDQTNSKEAFTTEYVKVAQQMQASFYPDIRKFYAAYRAIDQFIRANNYPAEWPPEMENLQQDMDASLSRVVNDKLTPAPEVYDACREYIEMFRGERTKDDLVTFYDFIEPIISKNWPNEPLIWLLKGEANSDIAWQARGGGTVDTVTEEAWKVFHEHLTLAETAAEKAWQLDPTDKRIPKLMMGIAQGLQKNRPFMELWFNRAMQIDTNYYEACSGKLIYLLPQWYGSREDMIAFGRECVASKSWGGKVPLALLDAHYYYWSYIRDPEEKDNYWKRPDVWPDIRASFDRFFELNPRAISWYHNYAWYAYHAEQWDKLNELIPKLENINYNYFGGKEEFDKMVELARTHGGGNPPPTK